MKKSSQINFGNMRKQVRRFALAPLGLAVLAGCSEAPQPETRIVYVSSVDECKGQDIPVATCEAAYRRAEASAATERPRFTSVADCEAMYGQGECTRPQSANSNNGSDMSDIFVPLAAAYIAGEMIDELGDAYETKQRYKYHPNAVYVAPSTRYNSNSGYSTNRPLTTPDTYTTTTRSTYTPPKKEVSKPVVERKPVTTTTQTRSGFGSTAKAKSSWSSSRSGGWGG